jgi:hypothetical protein
MRTRCLRVAGRIALATALAVVGTTPGTLLAADKDVVVVNTAAQPVPTSVQGTVNASVQGTVSVKSVDQPALQPFADIKSLSLDDGEAQGFIDFDPVPAGKRLVIETVTARAQAAAGQIWDVHLFVKTSGVSIAHTLEMSTFQTVGYIDIRTATLPVRLYADAGSQVRVFGHRQVDNTGLAGVDVTLSGHYVNVP